MTAAAALSGAVKRFGRIVALDGVDVCVESGDVHALLGANGAGKTTAIALLLGLRRPNAGTARVFGRDPRSATARAAIGVTPQEVAFPPTARVVELLDLVRAHYERPPPVDALVERFGLGALRRRQAGGLSGGEKRRLALALAFAGSPRAVFLDEPTTGLDVDARAELWETVREFAAAGGTVLLTTHDLDEAEALATRVTVLGAGVVLAAGTVDEIRRAARLQRVVLRTDAVPPIAGVARVANEGDRTTLYTHDAGAVLTALVYARVPLDGLEVRRATLEEAVTALTKGPR